MRDLVLIIFVISLLPVVIFRPYIGLLLWAWIGYMNPHRLTWSFAYNFRFNLLIAIATIIGILYTMRFNFRIPWKTPIFLIILFVLWTTITAMEAFRPVAALVALDKFSKVQIMIIATLILVKNRRQIIVLVAVIALSIGFFGLKGGIFTLTSGGNYRVMGPAQSFFEDNNALALALIMVSPLLYFLQFQLKYRILRLGMIFITLFSIISILGSYSRGGFVGLSVLLIAFWLKTRRKILVTVAMLVIGPGLYTFMPEKWHERMNLVIESAFEAVDTFDEVEKEVKPVLRNLPRRTPVEHTFFLSFLNQDTELLQDKSVSGRLDAWRLALLIVDDRPLLGGGFGAFEQQTFDRYTPGVYRHSAHSIYFEVLGEQGYPGFLLWVTLHLSALLMGYRINRRTRHIPELLWLRDLTGMLQVSLIGYYSAGTFLGMAYFDLPYHLISILVILFAYTENHLYQRQPLPTTIHSRWPHHNRRMKTP
ncbi:MAG: putative O-glycosylation ligase, exosortase A system-associated [Magnetococcales bacterium]|nr:putative O-glycosylation ligase, exosortase A system-associated [Magnetococcales bacterium]